MALSPAETIRYARHLALPEVGPAGQERLQQTRVLCVGAGGLGSPVLLYLAAAGVGHIGVVDYDTVDLSNLQRQIVHGTPDIGRPKTDSARDTLGRINPHVEVDTYALRLDAGNALDLIARYDIVVDGADNFPTRYLVNDACVLLRKPYVYGAIFRFEGQASLLAPTLGGPCYRCLFPEPPPPGAVPSCAEGGVLGVLPGLVGSVQATEVVKFALGAGEPLLNRLLLIDALRMRFREVKLRRDPACPVCGAHPTVTGLVDYDPFCGGRRGSAADPVGEVSAGEMDQALKDPTLGVVIVDLRESTEAGGDRLAGTVPLPFSQLEERCEELPKGKTLYLCCAYGLRSRQAVALLREHGFTEVKSVQGGFSAWEAAHGRGS